MLEEYSVAPLVGSVITTVICPLSPSLPDNVIEKSDLFLSIPVLVSLFTFILTFLLVVSVSFALSVYPPVIAFTFIFTVTFLLSATLFTVNVIVVPSSTTFPASKLCFATFPLSDVLSA